LLNPYLPGASVFVFTDISALLLVVLAFHMFAQERFAWASLALMAALLCRQYAIVFWIALAVTAGWGAVFSARRSIWAWALAWMAAAPLPLIVLMFLWGSLSPPTGRELWIVGGGMTWSPRAFTAYLAFLAVYLVPVMVLGMRRFRGRGVFFLAAVPLSLLYFVFPVQVSSVARIQAGVETVGLAHRALRALAGSGAVEHAVLWAASALGIWLLLVFLRDDARLWRRSKLSPGTPLSLAVYLFLLIMPFSYQIWEKYLLLVLPFAAVRFMLLPEAGKTGFAWRSSSSWGEGKKSEVRMEKSEINAKAAGALHSFFVFNFTLPTSLF
jgi:hypothetical protein